MKRLGKRYYRRNPLSAGLKGALIGGGVLAATGVLLYLATKPASAATSSTASSSLPATQIPATVISGHRYQIVVFVPQNTPGLHAYQGAPPTLAELQTYANSVSPDSAPPAPPVVTVVSCTVAPDGWSVTTVVDIKYGAMNYPIQINANAKPKLAADVQQAQSEGIRIVVTDLGVSP